MDFQAIVTITKDLVSIGTGLFLAWVAYQGLQTWKRQLKGQTEYDLAKRLLRAAYKVRDAFATARNIYFERAELIVITEESKAVNEEVADLVSAKFRPLMNKIFFQRYEILQNAFLELNTITFEAEVIWGGDARRSLSPLNNCMTTFQKIFVDYILDTEMTKSVDAENFYKHILGWLIVENRDSFSDEIWAAVEGAEAFLKPHLMKK